MAASYAPNAHEIASIHRIHDAAFGAAAVREAMQKALEDDHRWEPTTAERPWVHEWRSHVGEAVAATWRDMNFATRVAIALDAERVAGNEEWD